MPAPVPSAHPLHQLGVAVTVADATGPKGKLVRALQQAMAAYDGDELPTPREREKIRADMHAAVDKFLVERMEELSRSKRRE